MIELVGVHEVAEMLGVSKGTLAERRRRRMFPKPLAELRCGPVWGRWQIEAYMVRRDPVAQRRWYADLRDELLECPLEEFEQTEAELYG